MPGHYRLRGHPLDASGRRRSSAATTSPRSPDDELATAPAQLLIDGKLTPSSDGATYPILNPATGAEIGQAPDATAADVDAAIAAARRAFDETDWSTNHELRVRCLRQLHEALLATPTTSGR